MSSNEITEQSWVQRRDENARWYQRFSEFLALGAGRSVRAVYNAERGNERSRAVPASWSQASHRFEWQRRAEQYDAWRRAAVFQAGNASDVERVKKLDALTEQLYERSIGMLKTAPPEEGFNEKLIDSLLKALDLLAKHTGGYAPQRMEHTGKDGKAIQVESDEESTLRVVFYVPEISDVPNDGVLATLGEPGEAEEKQ